MKNRGIKYKTIFSVVIVVTICIGVLGLIVYQYFSNVLMEDALVEAEKKVSDMVLQLDSIESQMETITDYIITDRDVAKNIYIHENETIKDRNNASYEMSQILTRFVVLNEYLSGIMLVRSDGWVFSNNSELDNKYLQPYVQELLAQEEISEEHNRFFTNVHSIYSNTPAKSNRVISFVVRFSALEKRGEVDYLIMDMPFDKLQEIVEQGAVDFDNIEIYNYKNDLVYGDVENTDSGYHAFILEEAEDRLDMKDQVIIKNIAENGHWKAAVGISKGKLFAKISVVLMWFLLAVFITASVIIVVLARIMSNITRPIESLSMAMSKVSQGDYQTHVQVASNDEIEELANVFNSMTIKIQEYIEDSIRHERVKQELKLDLLMNQINPHFIYNTLNSIIYSAHENKQDGVKEITQSLINILQDSVKIGKHAIMDYVQVEVDIVDNYMNIQKYRYPERFVFRLECEEELKGMEIPKMMIQPLVENSLFHGVCLKETRGLISVRIEMVETEGRRWFQINVEDDGIGMTEEVRKHCFMPKEQKPNSNQTRSIGLNNIRERLEFLYGNEFDIEIWSEPKKGTRVRLRFPATTIKNRFV